MELTPDVKRYQENLQAEVESAALYRTMSKVESKPELAELYRRLAIVEETHAQFWRNRLRAAGVRTPPVQPGWRTRVLMWLAGRLGAQSVLPAVETLESMDRAHYDDQPEANGTQMPAQERSHARILAQLAARARPTWDGAIYSKLEGRHGAGGGNALRAAVLGANDGLVSNLSLVMGVAGAAFSNQTVLITGLAGMLAGACSMAMGEWVSVQSARELYRRQIATEKDELEQVPDEEREELVLIYQSKGLNHVEARAIADRVMADPTRALDTLSREELGINPTDLGGSAWVAAVSSFVVFLIGAAIPVLPFAWVSGTNAVITSAVLSAVALLGIGAAITIFTGRNALLSGVRQLAIGMAAAGVVYGAGRLFGVALAG